MGAVYVGVLFFSWLVTLGVFSRVQISYGLCGGRYAFIPKGYLFSHFYGFRFSFFSILFKGSSIPTTLYSC